MWHGLATLKKVTRQSMNEQHRQYLMEGQQAGMRYSLVVPRNAPWGLVGNQLANRVGSSLEFMDHREYQPGDDLRRIDWSAFARSDKLTVKLYREEVNPHLDIIIDGSRSMALHETAKEHAAVALASALVTSAANAAFTHTAFLTSSGCNPLINGSEDPLVWEGVGFDSTESPLESFARMPPRLRPNGIRILISDLLWMGDPVMTLSHLADRASAVYVIQVLARSDVNPPERGNIRLVDSESDELQEIFLDASAQKRYRDALSNHQQNWNRAAVQLGATMTTIVAEDVVENWNFDDLVASEILRVV